MLCVICCCCFRHVCRCFVCLLGCLTGCDSASGCCSQPGRALAVRRRGWERRPPLSSGSRRSRWQPVLSGGCSYGGAGWACAARRSREIRCPGGCDRSCPVIHFEWARCAFTRTLLAAWQPQVLSVFLFSSVICSNGAQRAAHSEPRCYRNTGAEILELEGVCVSVWERAIECVCVCGFFPRQRLQVVSHVSTVTARCMITKLRRVESFSPRRAQFRLCSNLRAVWDERPEKWK